MTSLKKRIFQFIYVRGSFRIRVEVTWFYHLIDINGTIEKGSVWKLDYERGGDLVLRERIDFYCNVMKYKFHNRSLRPLSQHNDIY